VDFCGFVIGSKSLPDQALIKPRIGRAFISFQFRGVSISPCRCFLKPSDRSIKMLLMKYFAEEKSV
jgi:hypothetical protein